MSDAEAGQPEQTPQTPGRVARALRKDDGLGPWKKWPVVVPVACYLIFWVIKGTASAGLHVYDMYRDFGQTQAEVEVLKTRDREREKQFNDLLRRVDRLATASEKTNEILGPLIRAKLLTRLPSP